MLIIEAYIKMFINTYDYSGRSRRRDYWPAMFLNTTIILILIRLVPYYGNSLFTAAQLYALVMAIPSIALSVRRLHDIGKSGWWHLISRVPIIGFLFPVFLCFDSAPDNEYGPNPKSLTIPTKILTKKGRLWCALIGISGCVLALWNLWAIYSWLIFLAYARSAKFVLFILWACVGCICVFLYSILDGKGERYFRLLAGIVLVMILLIMPWYIDKIRYEPQLLLCISGFFVALICLFYSSKPYIEKLVVLILFSYILVVWFYPIDRRAMFGSGYDRNTFFNYPIEFLSSARSYRTHLEKENQSFDGDKDITLDFEKYLLEHGSLAERNENVLGILSRGGVSLIVQEGQWYLRVSIPVLLPHCIHFNMPLKDKEGLISSIKKNVPPGSPSIGRVYYDGNADTYDIKVEAWPERQ